MKIDIFYFSHIPSMLSDPRVQSQWYVTNWTEWSSAQLSICSDLQNSVSVARQFRRLTPEIVKALTLSCLPAHKIVLRILNFLALCGTPGKADFALGNYSWQYLRYYRMLGIEHVINGF